MNLERPQKKAWLAHATAIAAVAIALAAIVSATACQTKPTVVAASPALSAPDASTIQAEARGLAPTGDASHRTLGLALLFGNPETVQTWKVSIASANKAVREFAGSGAELPESLLWDGLDENGAMAAEGSYTAALTVDYGTALVAGSAVSTSFLLDISPPSASFSPNPAQFGYKPGGVKAPVSVSISAKQGLAPLAAWSIDIYDAKGALVKKLTGDWGSTAKAVWDGKTDQGAMVSPGSGYPALLTVSDEFGNSGKFQGAFWVADIPAAQASSVSGRRSGFSPTSASVKNSLDLLTTYGSKESVVSWKLSVMSVSSGLIRSIDGDGKSLPEYSRWDGTDDSGALAADGAYFATLAVDYGKAYKPSLAKSASFSLATAPPSGSITANPSIITLAKLGARNPVNFTIEAKAPFAQIVSWSLSVSDQEGTALAQFRGTWPNDKVSWDGKSMGVGVLNPGKSYRIIAQVQDEYGNVGVLTGGFVGASLHSPLEPSGIRSLSSGFSPTGDKVFGTMGFEVEIGDPASVSAWRVDIADSDGIMRKSYTGTGLRLPDRLVWDGVKDDGKQATEGRYAATLRVDYGLVYTSTTASTAVFILDLSPPEASINLSTELFSPGGEGGSPTVTISLEATSSLASLANWSIAILDPVDAAFAHFKGEWDSRSVAWDGKDSGGELVESASDYTIVASVRDEYGNVGEARRVLPIDILVFKTADGYRIRVSSIVFKGFTADYKGVLPSRAARNEATLDLLARKLAIFPDYDIKLQGYAVMINWNNAVSGAIEQKSVLLPLSKARAEAIKLALSERGIGIDRLSTQGFGANDPVVPNSDYQNRWKNRRVEFYIVK